jgi:UBX domain-containing protein 6
MSFLKDLFKKSKDKKYGTGHRLGDTTPRQDQPSTSRQASGYVPPQQPKSEAAIKAGEAALQRLENAKNPSRPTTAAARQVAKELKQETEAAKKELDKEFDKALRLKDHYFGKPQVVDGTALVPKSRIYFTASVLPEGEKYVAGEIEDRIEQLLLEKLHEEPVLVACTLLCTANYKDGDKLVKCVEILNKFADNILNNPSEEKYRKIRVENAIFKEKVIIFDGSMVNPNNEKKENKKYFLFGFRPEFFKSRKSKQKSRKSKQKKNNLGNPNKDF